MSGIKAPRSALKDSQISALASIFELCHLDKLTSKSLNNFHVNFLGFLQARDPYGDTLLLLAIKKENFEAAQLLMSYALQHCALPSGESSARLHDSSFKLLMLLDAEKNTFLHHATLSLGKYKANNENKKMKQALNFIRFAFSCLTSAELDLFFSHKNSAERTIGELAKELKCLKELRALVRDKESGVLKSPIKQNSFILCGAGGPGKNAASSCPSFLDRRSVSDKPKSETATLAPLQESQKNSNKKLDQPIQIDNRKRRFLMTPRCALVAFPVYTSSAYVWPLLKSQNSRGEQSERGIL